MVDVKCDRVISVSEVVAEMDSAVDVIEINETGPSGEAQCAYRGDGTRPNGQTRAAPSLG